MGPGLTNAMILYPAIDLKDGKCVRLFKGRPAEATVFNDDPAAQASSFAASGCEWLHVVDLDAAFQGKPRNAESVSRILSAVSVPIQLGGGIRDIGAIENWIGRGVSRVVLGTAAVENPALVKTAAKRFPQRVAIGIDARNGAVSTRGWVKDTSVNARDLALRFEDCGVAAIVYTDIDRDGAMAGPNVAATVSLAESLSIPVIASGGIASITDIRRLRNGSDNLHGAIIGRALYDGAFPLAEALAAARAGRQ